MRGLAFSRLLMLVVLVPLIGLGIFGSKLTYDNWSRYSNLSRAMSVLRLAQATARFAGIAIPGEGMLNREVIVGRGDRSKLPAQRRVTDDLYRAIKDAAAELDAHSPLLDEQLSLFDERMQAMVALRAQVDAGVLKSPNESTKVVSPAAMVAVDLIGTSSAVVNDAVLSRRIFALYATLEFIESALVQRGSGEVALREGRLSPEFFVVFTRGVTHNETFGKLFRAYAPPEAVRYYNAFDAADGRDLAQLRKFALANAGQPASEAQIRRWLEINHHLSDTLDEILTATVDSVGAEGERMLGEARRDMFIYLGLTLIALIGVVTLARMVMRTVRDLLGELASAMDKMRDGNYDIAIPHAKRGDEIGVMARAVEGFRENFVAVAARENERKNAAATAERKSLLARLAGDFEAVIGNIVGAVSSASGELTTAATTLTKTAETTQQLSTTVAAASDEASTNVQSVAAATEEMTGSIGEIGRRVQESSGIAGEAVGQARKTDERIGKLAEAASRIGDVVKLITAIAEQTNLLALNATIEAARAGAAGKGFAVVAQEVKQLAAQTAKATSEISGQIGEMQAATQDSVAAIKEIGGTISRISEIATTIASAVEEQGAATQEISRNVQQAAAGTAKVAGNIADVNAGAAKTGAASAEVLAAARSLSQQSDRLTTEVQKFLATVRAA
jgi:methyl-accepting chemotaxis protein